MNTLQSPAVDDRRKTIAFYIRNDRAQQISLSGNFVDFPEKHLRMTPGADGWWKIEIPMLPKGTYRYKFCIDDCMYMEDVNNPHRKPDGINGWDSILEIP